jgi:hypothetical protein
VVQRHQLAEAGQEVVHLESGPTFAFVW